MNTAWGDHNQSQSVIPAGPVNNPQDAQQSFTTAMQTPPAISAIQKEHEMPVSSSQASERLTEPLGSPPELHPEAAELGVEKKHEMPQLTLEDKRLGITYSPESLPAPSFSSNQTSPLMTAQKAEETLKLHKKVQNAAVWLATLVVKHLKRIHEEVTKE